MRLRGVGIAFLAPLLLLPVLIGAPRVAWPAEIPALFETPPVASGPASSVPHGAQRREVVRQRRVMAGPGLLNPADGSSAVGVGQRIGLNLFDDATFSMAVTDVTRHGRGPTWSGTLDGIDLGYAILAVQDGALVGTVLMPGAVYRIGYAPDGGQVVEQIDPAALPAEAHSVAPALPAAGDVPDAGGGSEGVPAVADTSSQIDVMVVYTAAARIAAKGTAAIQAEISLAVASANQAYANNNLAQRVRLVFAGEVSITESTSSDPFAADLTQVATNPTVAWLRDASGADLVSFLTYHGPFPPFCGIGYLMKTNAVSFAQFGFSVVERACATSNLSFVHELGHNMGAHHDAFVLDPGETGVFAYSRGYVDLVAHFRTIMAYNNQCAPTSCNRIPWFSTPAMTYSGRVLGDAATADNARTLSETANTVANFRHALVAPPTVSARVNQAVFSAGQTVVTSVGLGNPGIAGSADIYVGLLLPDGTILFFTNVATPSDVAFSDVTKGTSFRAIATGVSLDSPFSVDVPSFVSHQWTGTEPSGGYVFFVLMVKAGALADGVLTSSEVLGASLAPFTVP